MGNIDGRRATPTEELAYLRTFKSSNTCLRFRCRDSSVNDRNYGVFSIPMSFLIDRAWNVRFIAMARVNRKLRRWKNDRQSDGRAAHTGDRNTDRRRDSAKN